MGNKLSCEVMHTAWQCVFFLAFRAGENYDTLYHFIISTGYVAASVMVVSIVAWFVWARLMREEATDPNISL